MKPVCRQSGFMGLVLTQSSSRCSAVICLPEKIWRILFKSVTFTSYSVAGVFIILSSSNMSFKVLFMKWVDEGSNALHCRL